MTDKPPLPLIEHEFVPCLRDGCGRYVGGDPSEWWAYCGKPRAAHRAEPPTAEPEGPLPLPLPLVICEGGVAPKESDPAAQ